VQLLHLSGRILLGMVGVGQKKEEDGGISWPVGQRQGGGGQGHEWEKLKGSTTGAEGRFTCMPPLQLQHKPVPF